MNSFAVQGCVVLSSSASTMTAELLVDVVDGAGISAVDFVVSSVVGVVGASAVGFSTAGAGCSAVLVSLGIGCWAVLLSGSVTSGVAGWVCDGCSVVGWVVVCAMAKPGMANAKSDAAIRLRCFIAALLC